MGKGVFLTPDQKKRIMAVHNKLLQDANGNESNIRKVVAKTAKECGVHRSTVNRVKRA